MTEEKKAPEIWAKVKGFCSHFIQSISTKVLLLMLLLILPFNFLAIWLSERTMSTLIEQARVSVQNSMNTYLTNLDYKMETTVKLLYNLRYNDIYGLTVIKQAGDEKYAGEKVKFYYSQKNYYDTTNVTDAWFIYLKKLDDVITWDGAFHSRKDDEVYIREQEEGEVAGGWTLATIKDREAARLFIDSGTVTYGGWIYLDTLLDDLKKDLDYESIELSFSDAEKKEAAKDELAAIKYMSSKTDSTNAKQVYILYHDIIDKKLFNTLIGMNYLKELQQFLYLSPDVPNEKIRPIPINNETKEMMEGRRELTEHKSEIRKLTKERNHYKDNFVISVIVNVVLVVVIAAMIYITLHSSNANVINYEVNLQDKYASWQEELQSQEESLNARERALNQQK